jgi:uncharacterized protein YhjY with autotransporter beta-barrel domain
MIRSATHAVGVNKSRPPGGALVRRCACGIPGLALSIVAPTAAWADLNSVPGMTPAEASAAAGTQLVYETLLNRSNLTPDQQRLFETVRELVETSNEQQGSGPTQFSLGLTVDGLRKALQWVAAEELTTPGTLATKTSSGQLANVAARFTALRHGVTGFRTSLMNNDPNNMGQIMLASAGGNESLAGLTGGDSIQNFSRLGGFFNASLGFGSKDPTEREDAFDYGNNNLTLGMDYRAADRLVYGGALGYTSYKADFNSSKSVTDGDVKSRSVVGSVYGIYTLDAFSVDGVASIGDNHFDLVRHIKYPSNNPAIPATNEIAYGSTDGTQYSVNFGADYENHLDKLTYSTQAHVNYLKATINGYTEQNAHEFNLQLEDQSIKSLTSIVGEQVSYALSRGFGVLMPEASLMWYHEFSNDSRLVLARYVADPLSANFLAAPTDNPDRDYFSFGIGTSAVFAGGLQAFVHYEALLGLSNISDNLFTGGVRLEF